MMKSDICFLRSCWNCFSILAGWMKVLTFCCKFNNRTQEIKESGLEFHPPALFLSLQVNSMKPRLTPLLEAFNSRNKENKTLLNKCKKLSH